MDHDRRRRLWNLVVARDAAPALASFIIKIIYYGPLGDTHIYWANEACPTGLYTDAPVPVESSTWGKIKALYE